MVERKDVESALAARHELGPEYEPGIVDSMVEKIEQRLAERERGKPATRQRGHDLRLPLYSMGFGVAVTAIGPANAVLIIAWIAIAIINVAYALRR